VTNKRVPIIGITCLDDRPTPVQHPPRFGQSQAYVHALARAGAAPLLIPQLPVLSPVEGTDKTLLRTVYELDVVIATNPLFPATAIEQRLEWAGVAGFPYQLVTTYENSRACKPNLLYYEQILKSIGHHAEACLMVGDDDMDMVAGHLGCATFLVPGPATKLL
jgi:FMN phosphatase YigB (HAD superfamily)